MSRLAALVVALLAARGALAHPIVVLTSAQPLYSMTHAVAAGSPTLVVRNLAPRIEGPHDYDPTADRHRAAFIRAARRADAIVTLRSLPLARHFDRLYPLARAVNIRIVEIDPGVARTPDAPRLPLVANPVDGPAAAQPATGDPNPHVWLSLSHAAILVSRIATDLARLDPAEAARYRRNAQAYRTRLLTLRADALGRLAELDDLRVAVLTEGFPYLTADLDLQVVEVLLGATPAAVTRRLRAAGVQVVLAEAPPSVAVVGAVEAAGARVVVLDTLEVGWGTGERLDPAGYLKGMRANVDRLIAALAGAQH